MISIFKKEISLFFSSLIAYISIGVFLLVTGLFLWVFPDTNVLDYGFASLENYFGLAPWVFLFLIPAVTMRSFSEEIKSGTIELLSTRPISDLQIVLGKYFAAFFLVLFALIPTLIYFYTIYNLGTPAGNIDTGATWGSYIGLMFLGATFTAIGLFASSITSNQIVSFIIGVFLCFFFFIAFDYLSRLSVFYASLDTFVQMLGIDYHYRSISRGVVDTRDVIYFLSVITVFILMTKTVLESRKW